MPRRGLFLPSWLRPRVLVQPSCRSARGALLLNFRWTHKGSRHVTIGRLPTRGRAAGHTPRKLSRVSTEPCPRSAACSPLERERPGGHPVSQDIGARAPSYADGSNSIRPSDGLRVRVGGLRAVDKREVHRERRDRRRWRWPSAITSRRTDSIEAQIARSSAGLDDESSRDCVCSGA
jgi:hypothetical protein